LAIHGLVLLIWDYSGFSLVNENPIPVPNERQLAWQEAEMGALFRITRYSTQKASIPVKSQESFNV
jgi:hypothetical protein